MFLEEEADYNQIITALKEKKDQPGLCKKCWGRGRRKRSRWYS